MEAFLGTVVQLVSTVVDEEEKGLEYLRSTALPKLRAKLIGCLNRSNIGRAVLNVLQQANLLPDSGRVKAVIEEMVDLEGVPVITLAVLDERMEEARLEVELACDQVGPDLRPGDIIYETV